MANTWKKRPNTRAHIRHKLERKSKRRANNRERKMKVNQPHWAASLQEIIVDE